MTDHSRLHTPDHDTDTELSEQVRPPLVGAATWTSVTARAQGRCECAGECGRSHARDGGRCRFVQQPGRPLHAVPRVPVPLSRAAALAAEQLVALCAACHAAHTHRPARSAAPETDALFDLGEVTQ